MLKVNCPSCGVRLTAPDELAGRPVTCQKCDTKFILSTRWTNEPLGSNTVATTPPSTSAISPPVPKDLSPPPQGITNASQSSSEIASQSVAMAESRIDSPTAATRTDIPMAITPQLKEQLGDQLNSISQSREAARHGTPQLDGYTAARSIIEFFDFRFRRYLTPTILKIAWLLVLVLATIWVLVAAVAYVSSLLQSGDVAVAGVDPRDVSSPGAAIGFLSPFVLKTALFFSTVISVALSLLATRVLFETIILLFSLANTGRAIHARLTDGGRENH